MKKTSLGLPLGGISLIISVFPPILENTILSFFLTPTPVLFGRHNPYSVRRRLL